METAKIAKKLTHLPGVQFDDTLKQSSLFTDKIEKATRIMTLVREKQRNKHEASE